MNIQDAYDQINNWIDASSGNLIDIGLGEGEQLSFFRKRLFDEDSLRNFELKSNIRLPEQYRMFLKNVGSVTLFADRGAGIEILEPSEIEDFSREVFDNAGDDLYPKLLLAISLVRWGYFGGFLLENPEVENYSVFYPDVPPEFWIEEAMIMPFDQWVIKLAESKGKKISTWA